MRVPAWISCMVSSCLRPWKPHTNISSDDEDDPSTSTTSTLVQWRRDLLRHSHGEFSYAVVQGNVEIEDHSQVEIGSKGIFVGVYDGHGGATCSHFLKTRLFPIVINSARDHGTISDDTLRESVCAVESAFMENIGVGTPAVQMCNTRVGSCCLAAVIWEGVLHIANLGDSRAVVGTLGRCRSITAVQLTTDHNCCREEIRQELQAAHPTDPEIVVIDRGAWRVKGFIQVSRTIGDAHLKIPGLLRSPLTVPVLSAEPSVTSRTLSSNDKFLIFASDGLWDLLTNQHAAEIVHLNPRRGIARKLIKAALKAAARRAKVEYSTLMEVPAEGRRMIHDDITVVVVFLDGTSHHHVTELSVRGFEEAAGPSNFRSVRNFG